MTKAQQLRILFQEKKIVRLIGAHDAIGARLALHHGFDGVWASGLEISTSHGVPDESILPMDQFFSAAKVINDASVLPVLCDCDTGFDDTHDIGSVVQSYEEAGLAGIVIEDKQFPKKNSFSAGSHTLADPTAFADKLKRAKNAQTTKDFMICARIESFIAGRDIDDALLRARAYEDAEADAIVIHSKSERPDEVYAFAHRWKGVVPLIAIPTSYFSATADELAQRGFAMVIYANHGLRASIRAMDETFKTIAQDGSTTNVEQSISPLNDVFDLAKNV